MSTNSTTKRTRRRPLKPYGSLLAWRQANAFNQRDAAAHIGISQSYYVKLETRLQHPSADVLKTLWEKTGVPVDALIGIAS